jgi:protein-tyrosine phosphatase
MAEIILRSVLDEQGLSNSVTVDSAGTGGWHAGDPMDERAAATLAGRGYDGSAHRVRQFDRRWFADRDLILVMDADNLRTLRRIAPPGADIRLFRTFDPAAPEGAEVPDPYFGGREGFEELVEMIEAAAVGLAEYLGERAETGRRGGG